VARRVAGVEARIRNEIDRVGTFRAKTYVGVVVSR